MQRHRVEELLGLVVLVEGGEELPGVLCLFGLADDEPGLEVDVGRIKFPQAGVLSTGRQARQKGRRGDHKAAGD